MSSIPRPRSGERQCPPPMPAGVSWRIRPVLAADLPRLKAWLPAGADQHLPEPSHSERWLLAEMALTAETLSLGESGQADDGRPQPMACLRMRPVMGRERLRHWYHVGCVVHAAKALDLFHQQNTLLLGNDHTGAAELADVAWNPAATLAVQAAALQHLLRSALLLMARQRAAVAPQLIVELPGQRDAAGQSPFWQGLGRHFYAGDLAQAAQRCGPAWRSHVAALLPRQPIYVSFLPPAAQAAIAQVPPSTRLLMAALTAEGLRYGHHVTIDDAGPVFEARIDTLPAVLAARRRALVTGNVRAGDGPAHWLVASEPGAGDQVLALKARASSPQTLVVPPELARGAGWAVPLSGE